VVVILAPVFLASSRIPQSYASIGRMKEPEELGRGYLPALSSFYSMEIMAGNIWNRRME
jgi:hypothetical protein